MVSHLEDTKSYAEQNPRPNTPLLAAGNSNGDGEGEGEGEDEGDGIQPTKKNLIPSDGGAEEENLIQRSGAGESKRHRDPDRYYTINISSSTKRELHEHKTRLAWELEQVRNMIRWVGGSSAGNQTRLPAKKKAKKAEDLRSESEKGFAAMMRKCLEIVNKIMKQRGASWFNAPVDVLGLGLYDYHQIIKIPMDLGTVKANLSKGLYQCPTEFAADVKLTFDNAMLYNPPEHVVHGFAKQLMVKFEKMYYPAYEVYKKRIGLGEVWKRRVMTVEEKDSLRARLEGLGMEEMAEVIEMLRKRDVKMRANGDEIELQFEDLDNDTLWALDLFLLNKRGQTKPIPTNDNIIINIEKNINDAQNKNKNNDNNNSDKLEVVVEKKGEEGVESEKESSGSGSSSSGSSSSSSSGSSSSSSSSSSSDSESESGRSLVSDPVQQTMRSQV
ncbi:Bromodomain-containing protein [Dioscorea alata]|uniref:Bromodomain-containing protein n=1 Tax=Dioscorea alata TaxID=55571 RepID=A0ACB7UVQ0_DIOAL|nr:Bromodomain-containing protein [Dioscorea alata]